ncbi:MAG: stage V sporulation protein AD [Oscillospiraceae bacterium]|jgi:stage V sporulation protein AD|nr:stage V sporulation protein AD [Oscillospiraceae bacterium]
MARRVGSVIELEAKPVVLGQAAVGGKIEKEGPLGGCLAEVFEDEKLGEKSWERAETRLQGAAIQHAIKAAGRRPENIDLHFGGDLLNQCTATGFALRGLQFPYSGVYSACASFAQGLALAALTVEGGGAETASTCGSSHFCAAEKQFRFPLAAGIQQPPTAQRTATAAGAAVLGRAGEGPVVSKVIFGRVVDYGVEDANEMGAAMAPAALDTLGRFLKDTGTRPEDYCMILTGDLGEIGARLLHELARRELGRDLGEIHRDGGLLLYDVRRQDVGVGGSGVGCSSAVVCADILPKLRRGELRRVLFIGTGALLSTISPLQGETIPSIAHGVLLERM